MQFWSLRNPSGHPSGEALPFEEVWTLQKALVERRARDEIPDTFLFLEHRSVIARGKGLQWTGESRERAMPLAGLPAGTDFFDIERGGDLTWHGPGQLVLYPIVKLDGKGFSENHDVTGYLRRLERATIALHGRLGVAAEARESATGVWVGDKKTASIGIAVRKWVTFHGIALNAVNDLSVFSSFSPCGFQPEVMSTLERLAGRDAIGGGGWRAFLEERWKNELIAAALRGPAEVKSRILSLTDLSEALIMKA